MEIKREHFNRKLNEIELIELIGENAVNNVKSKNCDYTNRVSAELDCNNEVEFSANIFIRLDLTHLGFGDMDTVAVTAYYYQNKDALCECDDLGSLDWEVRYYTLN